MKVKYKHVRRKNKGGRLSVTLLKVEASKSNNDKCH